MSVKYREGFKYQLWSDYSMVTDITVPKGILLLAKSKTGSAPTPLVALDAFGILTIRAGYAWDGASGPTVDTKTSMRASLVHDALYQLIRTGNLAPSFRSNADRLLRDICIQDGMYRWRAWAWWIALSIFGREASEPSHERPVIEAP